jgi:hypothetical protein
LVEKLQGIDAVHKAKRAFDMVFQSRDPFNEPLQNDIVSRAILFPSNYLFTGCPEQYEAIVAAATAINERYAYVSETEGYDRGIPFESGPGYHGIVDIDRISLDDLDRLTSLQGYGGISESALYSTKGTWGAITSHENHAVIGGTSDFMAVIADRIDLDASVREFLADYIREHERFGGDAPSWVPRLMRHVYGDENAARYLKEAEFPVANHD